MGHLEEQAKYWYENAAEAWMTARLLSKGKRNPEALFFCQLALEKLLKGLVVLATKETPPYIHDLVRLAQLANLETSADQGRALSTISGFNLKARYDDEKASFRTQATAAYTKRYMHDADVLRLWLQKKYPAGYSN